MFITLKTFSWKELSQAYRLLYSGLKSRSLHCLFKTSSQFGKCHPIPLYSFSSYWRSYLKGCRSICIMWDLKGFGLIRANTDMLTMLTSQLCHLYIRTTFIGEYCFKRSLLDRCSWTEYMSLRWSISFSFDSKELNSLGGGHQIWKAFLCFCNSPFLSLWHIPHISQDKYKPILVFR